MALAALHSGKRAASTVIYDGGTAFDVRSHITTARILEARLKPYAGARSPVPSSTSFAAS